MRLPRKVNKLVVSKVTGGPREIYLFPSVDTSHIPVKNKILWLCPGGESTVDHRGRIYEFYSPREIVRIREYQWDGYHLTDKVIRCESFFEAYELATQEIKE